MADAGNGMLEATERAVLSAALDRLIPTDEHGPGALDAGVLDYVTGALAGPYAAHRATYGSGLAALGALPRLAPAAQDELLRAAETSDDPSLAAFFQLLRQHAVEGMFADPLHGGNRDCAGWRLLGAPGPKGTFEAADQSIDVTVTPGWER